LQEEELKNIKNMKLWQEGCDTEIKKGWEKKKDEAEMEEESVVMKSSMKKLGGISWRVSHTSSSWSLRTQAPEELCSTCPGSADLKMIDKHLLIENGDRRHHLHSLILNL
jgi:hypothetical protein